MIMGGHTFLYWLDTIVSYLQSKTKILNVEANIWPGCGVRLVGNYSE